MTAMLDSVAAGNYPEAAVHARAGAYALPEWIQEEKTTRTVLRKRTRRDQENRERSQDRGLLPADIPVFERGGVMLALAGDKETLQMLQRLVSQEPEMKRWRHQPGEHLHTLALFQQILSVVEENPGCSQTEVMGVVDEPNKHRLAHMVDFLGQAGRLRKVEQGNVYRLWVVDEAPSPERTTR